jgi:ankyrin repeat protein
VQYGKGAVAEGSVGSSSSAVAKEETASPVEVGDLSFLVLLLRRGANVDQPRRLVARREVVSTPLFEAVCQGEVELARVFLEEGADPNVKGWARDAAYPEPALHVAARRPAKHQLEVCKLLLRHGADPSALAGDGGVGDDGTATIELVDAAKHASDDWIKSLIQGLQLAEEMRRASGAKAEAEEQP